MSGKEMIRIIRKKVKDITEVPDNTFKKKNIHHNKLLNSNNYKIENDEDFICEYSNELLNENIKLSGIISPFIINPIPCFTVKNGNSKKKIDSKGTFCKNIKTQIDIINNKEKNKQNNNKNEYNDKSQKTKILKRNIKKPNINNNKYYRPHSPFIDRKINPIFISENLELSSCKSNNNNNYELYLNNKSELVETITKNTNKINYSKPILSCTKKRKIKNYLFYSSDNYYGENYLYSDKKLKEIEENRNKRLRYIKLLGQKINVASMKLEILQNYKKNKDINSIKKKIEYNKIYCNNDLKRLKDNYYDNTNKHLKQIKYLKMKLLKCEEKFITIQKHKEIINKEELEFKIKKMGFIEKIILLKKRMVDSLNPESTTNDTYRLFDDSLEEQTINDMSFNDYSILRETIGVGSNHSYNFSNNEYFKEQPLYESKIIKIKPNEVNMFSAKFIKSMNDNKKPKLRNKKNN